MTAMNRPADKPDDEYIDGHGAIVYRELSMDVVFPERRVDDRRKRNRRMRRRRRWRQEERRVRSDRRKSQRRVRR